MFISDKEVRDELKQIFENTIPQIDVCVPILRGGKEILDRIPESVKKNWYLYPITIKSYSDVTNTTNDGMKIDIPPMTLNFIDTSLDQNKNILVVDDVFHTGRTLKFVIMLLQSKYRKPNVYYLIFADKSGNKNFGYPNFPQSMYFVRKINPSDWIEFEWEKNRDNK